jgi:hypothetical protein
MNRFACFALCTAIVTAASSETVYFHGPANDRYGFNGEDNGIRREWADDFALSSSAAIDQIFWWGGGTSPNGDAFVVRFFANNSGKPGQELFEATLGNGSPRLSDGIIAPTISSYKYSATLNDPFNIEANQKYWISIVNTASPSWLWQTSDENLLDGILRRNVGGSWGEPYGDDVAFALNTIPEPRTTLMLFAGAVMVIGCGAQSKKRRALAIGKSF